MIGQKDNTCQFQVCDSTRTSYFNDTFQVLKGSKTVEESRRVQLCKNCVEHIIAEKHAGRELCISPEGWIYIDNFRWLIFGSS